MLFVSVCYYYRPPHTVRHQENNILDVYAYIYTHTNVGKVIQIYIHSHIHVYVSYQIMKSERTTTEARILQP